MSQDEPLAIPETHVLAVASHVVYGYVGNTMAVQVLRFMGCDASALNTVHFSNHTGYRQVKGTNSTAQEIKDIYEGLKLNRLTHFDVMLSGYAPGAEAVDAVGAIARDLKHRARAEPGSFFWVLDPVMGDQGKLYVAEDVVPAYKALIRDADLILPNQFELEILTETPTSSLADLGKALEKIHTTYGVPHVVVTSLHLSQSSDSTENSPSSRTLSVVGSSRSSTGAARAFRIDVPEIDCYFSGTGDMFAALLVARLREAVAHVPGLGQKASWLSGDEVSAVQLPLCHAVCKVLASMSRVLDATKTAREQELAGLSAAEKEELAKDDKLRHLRQTRAAEVRLVRNARYLLKPGVEFAAKELEG